jgi:hypothetical protein
MPVAAYRSVTVLTADRQPNTAPCDLPCRLENQGAVAHATVLLDFRTSDVASSAVILQAQYRSNQRVLVALWPV